MNEVPAVGPRSVYVRESALHGWGVFAAAPHRAGAVLEVSPVLVIPQEQVGFLQRTTVYGYYFQWPGGGAALALGYGSLYNHAYHASACYDLDPDNGVIVFQAARPIDRNQEITINYNGDPDDLTPVWFEARA